MINKMMTTADEEFSQLKKPKPFFLEDENPKATSIRKEEIGLLDLVVLDGVMNREACNQ